MPIKKPEILLKKKGKRKKQISDSGESISNKHQVKNYIHDLTEENYHVSDDVAEELALMSLQDNYTTKIIIDGCIIIMKQFDKRRLQHDILNLSIALYNFFYVDQMKELYTKSFTEGIYRKKNIKNNNLTR